MGEIKDITGFLSKQNLSDFVFVETGTYIGDSALAASHLGFKKVYTIELQMYLYKQAKSKLASQICSGKVEIILGDSKEMLPHILDNHPNDRFVFWLDAHIDGGNYRAGVTPNIESCPLYSELQTISRHSRKDHIIIIDDLRIIGTEGWGIGVNKEGLIERIMSISSSYNIHFENGVKADDIMVASIG